MIFRNKREQFIEAWLIKFDRGLSEAEEIEFKNLTRSDPEVAREIRELLRPWDAMNEYASEIDPAFIAEAEAEDIEVHSIQYWVLRVLTSRSFAVSGLCILLVSVAAIYYDFQRNVERDDSVLVVRNGEEPLTKRFDDGSIVRVNKGTQITYRFTDKVRLVHIADGEAFFEVAKNPDLPFVVYNKRIQVKALGTAFNVKVTEFDVGVSVTEGRVEILANEDTLGDYGDIDDVANGLFDSGETLDILNVGEKTVVRTENDLVKVAEEVPLIIEELQWKEDLSTFSGSTLQELSLEFERKTGIKLLVKDDKIHHLEVVGSFFSTNDPYVILDLIERNYGIHWEHTDAQTIVVGELE